MRGIPTVLITVLPDDSKPMRPPRAIYPKGFKLGHGLGGPGQKELQKKVLLAALSQFTEPPAPGEIKEMEFPEYGG